MSKVQKDQKPKAKTFLGALWQHYHYFFWAWIVITLIVVVGYQTTFDFERICTYQYCPSSWVLAACTGCLVLAAVWANFFFLFLRPMLQLLVGRVTGSRVVNDANEGYSAVEILFYGGSKDYWSPAPGASFVQHVLVTIADFLCIVFFLMLPIAAIISVSSGIAYLEQKNSPPPPGLARVK